MIAYPHGSGSGIVTQKAHWHSDCGENGEFTFYYYIGSSGDVHPCEQPGFITVNRPDDGVSTITNTLGESSEFEFSFGTTEPECIYTLENSD